MIVVANGSTVNFSGFTVNGNDQDAGDIDVATGILFDGGHGSVSNMRFINIGADVGDEPRGTGLIAWAGAQVTVTASSFEENERRGLTAFDSGTYVTVSGSSFVAKTAQDETGSFPGTVDYGVQVSDGALVDISGSSFTGFAATENGANSAGVLVAPVFGGASTVNLSGNTFTNNLISVAVGFNDTDTDTVNFTGLNTSNSTVVGAHGLVAFGDVVVSGVPANLNGDAIRVDWTGGANANALFGDDQNDRLEGGGGNDTIQSGGGDDVVIYNVGDGHDTVDGEGGTDTLNVRNFNAGVPSATSATFTVSESASHLVIETDGVLPSEVDAVGMESLHVQLGDGGDTLNLSGNIAAAGIATGAGGIVITGGIGGDIVNASGLTSGSALTLTNLGGGDDTFRAANTNANDSINAGSHGGTGDTADYSAATAAVTIDLDAGTASGTTVGSDTITNFENATGGASGDSISGTSANNALTGGTGDDTLAGRGGSDTLIGGETSETHGDVASYSQIITAAMIASNGSGGWTVTAGGAEGTDTLSQIEIIQSADPDGAGPGTGRFLLVGNGGYTSLEDAVAEANDGDTIMLAPGTIEPGGCRPARRASVHRQGHHHHRRWQRQYHPACHNLHRQRAARHRRLQ